MMRQTISHDRVLQKLGAGGMGNPDAVLIGDF
jgi:hypothetical protein